MGKSKDDSAEIQRLLEEKAQVEQWLEKIRAAGSKTPESVRAKVESDYLQRLDAVMAQLEGFGGSLSGALAKEIERRDALTAEEEARSTELAEAELRYTVGEYDDAQWEEVRGDLEKRIGKVRRDLEAAEREIARVEEVLRAIEGGAAPGPTPAPPERKPTPVAKKPAPKPQPTSAAELEEPEIEEPDIELPEAVAVPEVPEAVEVPGEDEPVGREVVEIEAEEEPAVLRVSQQTDAFDEMEFLRSVTEDERQGPSASRASGVHRLPFQDLVSPIEEIAPESGGTESLGGEDVAPKPAPVPEHESAAAAIGAEGVQPVGQQKGRPTKGTQQKTVKCGECGALNLPTEWYCERCGAELAAL